MRLHAAGAEGEQDRLLGPLVDVPAGVGRRRDAHAAVVEQGQRLLDGGRGLLAEVARRALVELLDLGGEGGQVGGGVHAPDARRSAARRQSSGVGTSAMRTWPSPPGPKYGPGAITMPCSLEQAQRVALGVLAVGHPQPQEERGVAAGGLQAGLQQGGEERRALGAIALADLGHVLLVGPRGRGRALDEGLRRDADVRAVALEGGDDRGIAGGEARAIAGHRRALGERVEDDDVGAVGELQGADRRVAGEPQLRVGLVGGHDEVVLARQRRGALVELGRRRGRRRVVGMVQPQQRDAVPVDGVEVRLPAARGVERELDHLCAREQGAAGGHGIAGRGDDDAVAAPGHDLGEVEDGLLGALRGDDLGCRDRAPLRSAAAPSRRSPRAARAAPRPPGRSTPARPPAPAPTRAG